MNVMVPHKIPKTPELSPEPPVAPKHIVAIKTMNKVRPVYEYKNPKFRLTSTSIRANLHSKQNNIHPKMLKQKRRR